jgi:hypothetical protein
MSTTSTEALRFDAENAVARLRAEKIAVANMLYFSATDDIYHFSNSSDSEKRRLHHDAPKSQSTET